MKPLSDTFHPGMQSLAASSDEFAQMLEAKREEARARSSAQLVQRPGEGAECGAECGGAAGGGSHSGSLVVREHRETGTVKKGVFVQLARAANLYYVGATLCLFIVSQLISVGRDWYLAFWTDARGGDQRRDQAAFIGRFAALTVGYAVSTFARALALVLVGYRCSIVRPCPVLPARPVSTAHVRTRRSTRRS